MRTPMEAATTTLHEHHLARAERHIVEAEGRVTRQRLLVERLETGGHDPAGAKELLAMVLAHLNGRICCVDGLQAS